MNSSFTHLVPSHVELGLQFPLPESLEDFIELSLNITEGKGCLLIFSICKISFGSVIVIYCVKKGSVCSVIVYTYNPSTKVEGV